MYFAFIIYIYCDSEKSFIIDSIAKLFLVKFYFLKVVA
jgi:hypothetical protein